ESLIDSILRILHGTSGSSNDPGLSLEQVQHECTSKGVAFKITSNIHSQESLEFVKGLGADLGVIYGTRVLRPELFLLPRRGTIKERPQGSEGTVYKGYKTYQIWDIERKIRAKREKYKPRQGRPLHKLLLRTLLYPVVYLRNRRFARGKNFPIVILYHHVISD